MSELVFELEEGGVAVAATVMRLGDASSTDDVFATGTCVRGGVMAIGSRVVVALKAVEEMEASGPWLSASVPIASATGASVLGSLGKPPRPRDGP